MGCSSSTPVVAVPDSGNAPVTIACKEVTSVLNASFSLTGSSVTPQKEGVLFQHIQENGQQGLELLTSFPKMVVPPMPGLFSTEVELKVTMHTIFKPVDQGKTLDTIVVYTPLVCDSSIGFMSIKVNMNDGWGSTVQKYASEGYRLAGMGLAGGQTSTKWMGAKSTSTAELVFQKVEPSPPSEALILQAAINVKMNMGSMSSTVPDFVSILNKYGQEGWSLSGILLLPGPPPQPGVMSFNFDQPVQIVLHKPQGNVIQRKYCSAKFFQDMVVSGMKPVIKGDPIPLVASHAEKGWQIKAMLTLPSERSGMTGMKLPSLLLFEAAVVAVV